MNPYESIPDISFWKTAVANKNLFDIDDIWQPKHNLDYSDKVVTFGSCFAQHIGQALKKRGFTWLNTEPAPEGVSDEIKKKFNYEVFSCRTGNIYSTKLLLQWVKWSINEIQVPQEFWVHDGRYYDPFRPEVEPNGFISEQELRNSQKQTIASFNSAIREAQTFVFTLGLTEAWEHIDGYVYPMCPGIKVGEFNKDKHFFKNYRFDEIAGHLAETFSLMKNVNPKIRILLTVSPVPLTATYTSKHVLLATVESKSVLRAISGQFANDFDYIDYFPSFEMIFPPPFKGIFYNPNQRNVNQFGVDFVMNSFFIALNKKFGLITNIKESQLIEWEPKENSIVCEEELLNAFR